MLPISDVPRTWSGDRHGSRCASRLWLGCEQLCGSGCVCPFHVARRATPYVHVACTASHTYWDKHTNHPHGLDLHPENVDYIQDEEQIWSTGQIYNALMTGASTSQELTNRLSRLLSSGRRLQCQRPVTAAALINSVGWCFS